MGPVRDDPFGPWPYITKAERQAIREAALAEDKAIMEINWPTSMKKVGVLPADSKTVVYTKDSLLPTDAQARKNTPLCTGVLDYFPLPWLR